ncbi:MAG: GerAB/ArcD/ProY family transporter [Christensenellales bacterium]
MNSQPPEIKRSQYTYLLAAFIMGSYLIMTFVKKLGAHDLWIIIVSGFLLSVPLLLCFVLLSKKFPNLNLAQILETVYGRIGGKAVAFLYFLNFLLLSSFNHTDVASFYGSVVMPETPQVVFLVVFGLLCAFAASRGIAAVAKISLLVVVYTLLTSSIATLLLAGKIDLKNFLPFFEMPAGDYLQASGIYAVISFGEAVILLSFMPMVKNKVKLPRYTVAGMAVALLFYLVVIFRDTSVLGPAHMVYNQSAYQSARMINIADFITRVELLITASLTSILFIKNSVLLYGLANTFRQIFGLKSYRPILLPLGSIAVVLALVKFPSEIAHLNWGLHYAFFYSMFFNVLFPLATLLVAKLRGFKTPKTGMEEQDGTAR